MKVKIITIIFLLSCGLLGCFRKPNVFGSGEYIYKVQIGSELNVYDVSSKRFNGEYVDDIGRRVSLGYSSSIIFCSNDVYLCIDGGVHFVVPRENIKEKYWKYYNVSCESNKILSNENEVIVKCNNDSIETKFSFSRNRGIISYIRSNDPLKKYILIGDYGIFSSERE